MSLVCAIFNEQGQVSPASTAGINRRGASRLIRARVQLGVGVLEQPSGLSFACVVGVGHSDLQRNGDPVGSGSGSQESFNAHSVPQIGLPLLLPALTHTSPSASVSSLYSLVPPFPKVSFSCHFLQEAHLASFGLD